MRGVVLLGGAVRRTAFLDGIDRPTMMLPVTQKARLIDLWARALADVSEAFDLAPLDCQVVVDRELGVEGALPAIEGLSLSVKADPGEYRGTGGLLADLSAGCDADDFVLMAPAATHPPEDLPATLRAAARMGTDVSILVDQECRPLDLFLIRVSPWRPGT